MDGFHRAQAIEKVSKAEKMESLSTFPQVGMRLINGLHRMEAVSTNTEAGDDL